MVLPQLLKQDVFPPQVLLDGGFVHVPLPGRGSGPSRAGLARHEMILGRVRIRPVLFSVVLGRSMKHDPVDDPVGQRKAEQKLLSAAQ